MPLRLPPLAALRLFEAAGRHLSFRLAAEELGLTPSAVSHGIAGLEEWLGVALFVRGKRGLSLTAEGADYLRYVADALSLVALGTQRLPAVRPDRAILISCAPTFAARWLLPRLHRFRERAPGVGIAVDTVQRQVGFPIDGVDLAIRMGRSPWPGLVCTHLFGEILIPVGTRSYLRDLTGADGSVDLAGATLLHVTTVSEDWDSWIAATGARVPVLSNALRFDTVQLAIDAAIAGLGVAIGRIPLIDRELAQGTLVAASDRMVHSSTGYWLVGPETMDRRSDLTLFAKWLAEEVAGETRAGRKRSG